MNRDLILAFDTASEHIALALGTIDGRVLATDDHPARREANVQLMPSIEALCSAGGFDKNNIACVVCGRGPGSFTGVRIAIATAKGLAYGLANGLTNWPANGPAHGPANGLAKGSANEPGVPLYGVSTLDAIAWGAQLTGLRGTIGVVADAMRKEVYPARFELLDTGVLRRDPHTVAKADAVAAQWRAAGEPLTILGDGLQRYGESFASFFSVAPQALWVPTGRGLLHAFWATDDAENLKRSQEMKTTGCFSGYSAGKQTGDPAELLPIYTRLSDAEENERKRLSSNGAIAQGALVEVPRSGVANPALFGSVVYRPMASDDLDRVASLELDIFANSEGFDKEPRDLDRATAGLDLPDECWTRAMFADDLPRNDRSWWVAYQGDTLVGFAGGWVIDGELQILDIAVDPGFRRQGIARRLMSYLIDDASALGAGSVSLEVRASNEEAQAFYLSLGLKRIGLRPNYYTPRQVGKTRENAVLFSGQGLACAANSTDVVDRATNSADVGGCAARRSKAALIPHIKPYILAIETSCDETAAAVIDGKGRLLSDVVASQVDFHARFGGVVPEIASRKHTESIVSVIDAALADAALADASLTDAALADAATEGLLPVSRAFDAEECDKNVPSPCHVENEPSLCVTSSSNNHQCSVEQNVPSPRDTKQDMESPFEALSLIDAIAVTYAPGLIGALVVGVAFAKGLSWAIDKPLIKVNHLEGHIYSNRLENPDLKPPFIIALLSGGNTMLVHVLEWGTYKILGQTLDDAVGEAFDKVAKALGLGYPGGPVISKLAEQGDPFAISFPRALINSKDYRFSLSGLKTAVVTYIRNEQEASRTLNLPDLAASFQQAIIDVQVAKALDALEHTGTRTFCLGGGVAANKALRDAYKNKLEPRGIRVIAPAQVACTDNAAMIAAVALDRYRDKRFATLADDALASVDLEQPY